MLELSVAEKRLVQEILARHVPGIEVRAFGSRTLGKARPCSDLDLLIMSEQPLPLRVLGDLREAFQESDLLFRVDLVQWRELSPEFRASLARSWEVIQTPARAA
jgi:predicted nucleotidyltransferase